MVGKSGTVKCAKCGISSLEDTSLHFHRFPHPSKNGSLKAKVWATYCYPNEDWNSDESLEKLTKQHRMICGKHFDQSSYTSTSRKRLNNFAIPIDAQHILKKLREEKNFTAITENHEFKNSMAIEMTSNSRQNVLPGCSGSIENQQHLTNSMAIEMTSNSGQNVLSGCSGSVKLTEKRKFILKDLNVQKLTELTPRKQKLYKRCRKNLSEIMRLRKKIQGVKKCKRSILSSLESNKCVQDIMKSNLSSSFYLLLQSQLKNAPRKLSGRRWTLDDKILALSIYKKSSSCYRLLRRLFCLPSIGSLKMLLNKIPMICGVNNQVIETVKEITANRGIEDNICMLAFDEMSIRKNLIYNSKLDQLDGYQDHAAQGRTTEIASHALVFMAIGVRKPWKQPIAHYFSGQCVTADRLSVLIKDVISSCFHAGLEVLGVVCDMDGVNVRAINSLGSTTENPYFLHEGHEIVTLFDPPHLLKSFRNNFMKHDIEFKQELHTEENPKKVMPLVAKWKHIREFYEKDKTNTNFVYAPALSEQHFQLSGKQKMKVSLAAQVLSHSVASGMFARISENSLPQEAIAAATVVSNMDKLFDCMNGSTSDRKRGKPYLTNMSSTSPHLDFFVKMRDFFKNLKFIGAKRNPPSQEGWLRTLNGIEKIYLNLKKFSITTLSVRRLNQDPLENCFGCIRSNCGCNPNPTVTQFIAALKTSIITNLINNNKNRNCLDDKNDILHNFKIYLGKGTTSSNESISSTSRLSPSVDYSSEPVEEIDSYCNDLFYDEIPQCSAEMQACAYVCGFIVKYMAIKCVMCKRTMLANPNTEVCHIFTSFKEYDEVEKSLHYVQHSFCDMVEKAAIKINNYLKDNSHKKKIKENLISLCQNLNKEWLKGCDEHKESNFNLIIKSTVVILLKRFCRLKNLGFVEEASKIAQKKKINILKHV